MNHDDKNPDLQTWIDPEMEARIVAAVLGEASVFEKAQLERAMAEKPELAIFKRRVEAVHGLLGEAWHPQAQPLQLSAERRAKVIDAIGPLPEAERRGARDAHILQELAAARRERQRRRWWGYGIAGSLAAAALIMMLATPSFLMVRKSRSYAVEYPAKHDEPAPMLQLPVPEEVEGEATPELAQIQTLWGSSPRATSQDTYGSYAAGQPKGGKMALGANPNGRGNTVAIPQQNFNFTGATNNESLLGYKNTETGWANANLAVQVEAKAKREAPKTVHYPVTGEEAVLLSPFAVFAEPNVTGYSAANSLAGTRVKTNLGDLTSSVTIANRDLGYSAAQERSQERLFELAAKAKALAKFEANDGFLGGTGAQSANRVRGLKRPDPMQTGSGAVAEDQPLAAERAATPVIVGQGVQQEISTAVESVSTFSLHVSDASYKLAQAALARGEQPDAATIRPEEFYNAFDYGDPAPTAAEKIACRIEQSAHPLLQQRNFVRIAMRVPTVGRGAAEPLRLTVLLDTSGSMEREDRAASVQRALQVLATLLGPNDRVTLVGFARQPRLLAEELPGDAAGKLVELAARTPYTGGTNLEEGLKLAGELAKRHRVDGAQNRIVLITDGAANLGSSNPEQLAKLIEQQRRQGVAFDACGVGTDGMDDAILEALTRKGDGRYYVLDRPEEADANFARQLAGAFRPAAENVKVQVRFNPARVGRYRLIGFEQHRLKTEDFRNDQVDAAELAAGEAAVALYQVEVLPQGEGELGDVFVRFRDPASRLMVERSWTMRHEPHPAAFDRASPAIQLAGTAALVAEKLRGGDGARAIKLDELEPVVNALRGKFAGDARIQAFLAMFEKIRRGDR